MNNINILIKFNDNKSNKCIEEFVYIYDKRKINIKMFDESFWVSFNVIKSISPKSIEYLFVDAIKKIYLIYTIYNNKLFFNDKISFYINGKLYCTIHCNKSDIIIYSLFDSISDKITPHLRNKHIIERIISYPKSKYNYKIASLFAYICAKSKKYECERLQYYWMSINGYYNKYKENNDNDNNLINKLLKDYKLIDVKEMFGKKDRDNSVLKVVPIIREIGRDSYVINKKTTKKDIDNRSSRIKEKLKEIGINNKIDPYGYVLTQIPYYYRCNMFHGSDPVNLFLTICEDNILVLKVINDILEEFLDLHIADLFSY